MKRNNLIEQQHEMEISQLLNHEEINEKEIQDKHKLDAIKYKAAKPKEGTRHLTWKEKQREKALRWKNIQKGLTEEENDEYNDLTFIEVVAEGYSITPIIKKRSRTQNIINNQRRIQTRSITRLYKEELERAKRKSFEE